MEVLVLIPSASSQGSGYDTEQEALAISRVFSLVDAITNTKFSNCTHIFEIGAVRQQNMQVSIKKRFKAIYH